MPENKGFAGGCNAGIARAAGRYIATLNNDAEADRRWLQELVAGMESDRTIGMCASKILFHGDRKRIDKVGHLMYPDGLNHGRGSGETDRGQFEERVEVLFPDAAGALYRRDMLDVIGFFDVGSSGQYAAECSRGQLAVMMLKAYWSGLKFFPEMWRSRLKIRRSARLTNRDFAELIRRHRISVRALTLGT